MLPAPHPFLMCCAGNLKIHKADSESERLRPPPTTDGTPNESAHDVFVRVRQMMSVIETQYNGDSVIVVSPDSDNLSILQAALTGLDLRRSVDLFVFYLRHAIGGNNSTASCIVN